MSSNRLFSGIAFGNCDDVVSVSTLFPFTCSAFFADERFNEAEAQNWLKRNKEK